MEGVKFDKSGYEVKTSSDSCIFAINAYYHQVFNLLPLFSNFFLCLEFLDCTLCVQLSQVLSYGRDRRVILEAPVHDKDCVLANILAAHFLFSSDPSEASLHIEAAKSRLVIFFSLYLVFPWKVQGILTRILILNCCNFPFLCFEQEQATFYEKAVFDVVNYLISENRDDDVAVELHSKVD